ncbi:MAG: CPBP family intramembrane glutamic endopeptidase [Chloroflexota bacterium]
MRLIPRDAAKDFTRHSPTAVLLAAPALVLTLIPLSSAGTAVGGAARMVRRVPGLLAVVFGDSAGTYWSGRRARYGSAVPSAGNGTSDVAHRIGCRYAGGGNVIGRHGSSHSPRERVGLTITALMNGVLEEVFWRGLFSERFPRPVWGVVLAVPSGLVFGISRRGPSCANQRGCPDGQGGRIRVGAGLGHSPDTVHTLGDRFAYMAGLVSALHA